MRLEDKEDKRTEQNANPGQYDRLLKTRSLLLSGEINKDSADRLIKDLLVLEGESNDPVTIFINSPGGDVDAGFAIYDMVRFVSCPVTMVGMGLIASAASLILLAVPAERRVGLPNSSYLIHQPLSQMKGNAVGEDEGEAQPHNLRSYGHAVGDGHCGYGQGPLAGCGRSPEVRSDQQDRGGKRGALRMFRGDWGMPGVQGIRGI